MSDQDEIAKRVAAANKAKEGQPGKRQAINPRPNRVDSQFMDPMRDQALEFWGEALLASRKLVRAAIDAANDDELTDKDKRARINTATSFSPLLKHLAQFASGAVHPAGSNTVAEKELAAERVALARQKFTAKEEEALAELIARNGKKDNEE
ncbi:hypothetical protein [Dongia sp.]|uniref:hypothetical protein n=1 Tax=Dongia sp. TaxID=1977262 RepID=UPI0035B2413D